MNWTVRNSILLV